MASKYVGDIGRMGKRMVKEQITFGLMENQYNLQADIHPGWDPFHGQGTKTWSDVTCM